MKKIFLFVFVFVLLCIPFTIYAEEVKVKDIIVEGLGESSYDEDNINLVSEFNDVNDTIKYIITLENMEDKDIDVSINVPKNNYVEYKVDMATSIPKKGSINATVTVKYINSPSFHNNTYLLDDTLGISFKEKIVENENIIEVPNTLDTNILIFMGILLISVSLYGILIIKYKKGIKYTVILILPIIAMGSYVFHSPVSYALKIININSKITINSKDKYIKDDIIYEKDSNSNLLLDFGDVIKINDEKFYVLSTLNNRVKAFSMYNLNAGGEYNTSTKDYTVYMTPTYKQDQNMTGIPDYNNVKRGVSLYGNTLTEAFDKYKEYLNETTDISVVRAPLEEDMALVGCSTSLHSCASAPTWVYNASYFTYLYTNPTRVWEVSDGGYFNVSKIDNTYSGIRCVIEFELGE